MSESKDSSGIKIMLSVIGFLGVLVTAYFGYLGITSQLRIPISATQTAEAKQATLQAGYTSTVQVGDVVFETPTNISGENTLQPTDTATPTVPAAIMLPSLCCLDSWDIFSSDGADVTPSASAKCSNLGVDELGIHTSECDLIFGVTNLKQRGVYGLSTPISHDVAISVTVSITTLIEGELWLGFSSSVNPQSGSLVYAMTPDPGGVSVFLNNISTPRARYPWAPMGKQIGWEKGQPQLYNFVIKLDGNKVEVTLNSVTFATEVASSTDRFFLGYRSKPEKIGTYLNVTISDLNIEAK